MQYVESSDIKGDDMVYVTGDTHGDFSRYKYFVKWADPKPDDVMVILGDAALNYTGNGNDRRRKCFVNSFPFATFCVHGNHEMRPEHIPSYEVKDWYCGHFHMTKTVDRMRFMSENIALL